MPAPTPQRYLQYLSAVRGEFTKLARLDFLQPDGSLAFSIDNNPHNPRSGSCQLTYKMGCDGKQL